MNNAITEIESTLEGTNSRITEAEDRISEVEDRMAEINETERKKEKEFRITIAKMIQNLENKMELQINRLEIRIEKMQEMFNKDLEET